MTMRLLEVAYQQIAEENPFATMVAQSSNFPGKLSDKDGSMTQANCQTNGFGGCARSNIDADSSE